MSQTPDPNRPASAASGAEVSSQATSDLPTAEDHLGFKPYVESLRDFLIHEKTKPPLTLSIEGEWGTGKSSFMEQLVGELDARGKIVVRFNAWRHDKEDSLWSAFALTFISEVSKNLRIHTRLRAAIELRLRRYDWRAGWFRVLLFIVAAGLFAYQTWFILKPQNLQLLAVLLGAGEKPKDPATPAPNVTNFLQVGGLALYIAVAVYLVKKLKDFFVNPLSVDLRKYSTTPDYKSHSAFIEDFHTDFTKIVRTYAPRNRRIFVLIDDLDRCEIPKAADLMQAINLMLSASDNLIFIIGMDREKVAAGLAVKYEKLLPFLYPAQRAQDGAVPQTNPAVGLDFGYEFIEKFIQLPFAIPQASPEDIKGLLAYLNGIKSSPAAHPAPPVGPDPVQVVDGDKDSNEIQEMALMVAEALDFNPRRIKHFINSFRLRTRLAAATGLFATPASSDFDPLTLHRLGKFVAISLRWPRLMSDLHNNRELLSDLQEIAWSGRLPRPSDPVVSYWTSKPKLIRLLLVGFPQFGQHQASSMSPDNKDAEKKLTEPDRYDPARRKYALTHLNVEKLLGISPPRVLGTRPPGSQVQGSAGLSGTIEKMGATSEPKPNVSGTAAAAGTGSAPPSFDTPSGGAAAGSGPTSSRFETASGGAAAGGSVPASTDFETFETEGSSESLSESPNFEPPIGSESIPKWSQSEAPIGGELPREARRPSTTKAASRRRPDPPV